MALTVAARVASHTSRIFNISDVRVVRLLSSMPTSPDRSIQTKPWKWEQPTGYNTGIQVYNTIAHEEVPLILNNSFVTWYMCGPTVYDKSHIGHASSYVRFDIIRRILERVFNIHVVLAMGITDVDDKLISRSKELGITVSHLAKQYEQEFFHDMSAMRVLPPTVTVRVTDHIPQIISVCKKIVDDEAGYVTPEGTVYFDVAKFGQYGKLSSQQMEGEVREALDAAKRSPRDFALWKAAKPGEVWWLSPWGKGRPGWHIECSAMASHIFGSTLDIHTGGKDLIFPHHENENVQSEAYHGICQWANYWLHTGHLHLRDDVKMSKSLQNTISVQEFLKENTVNEFRIFCLRTPYQNDIEYASGALEASKSISKKLHLFLNDCASYIDGSHICGPIDEPYLIQRLNETKCLVRNSLSSNFNTRRALGAIMDFVSVINQMLQLKPNSCSNLRSPGTIAACSSYVADMMDTFGIQFVGKREMLTSEDDFKVFLARTLDAVLHFRNRVRVYALTTGPSSLPQFANQPQDQTAGAIAKDMDKTNSLPQSPGQPPNEKGDIPWTTTAKQQIVQQRKEREPLMKACDDLRDDLFMAGIQIRDKGKVSTWTVLEDRTIEGKKSSVASHDAFDPQYKPRPGT